MAAPVPSVDELLALPTDEWSALLAVALPVLRALPAEDRDAAVVRTVAVPPARLVGGRPRERFAALVRRPGVWRRVADELPDDVLAALAGTGPPAVDVDADALAEALARATEAEAEATAAADRASSLRDRLDETRRQAEGAEARARAAERRAAEAEEARAAASAEAAALAERLADAADERDRAIERERRRAEARDDRERAELRTARRRLAELEEEVARLTRRLAAAEATASRVTTTTAPERGDGRDGLPGGGRRGRPSVLPEGLVAGTRDAAAWLVSNGVPLLVDGYNVTRTHRGEAAFDEQRRWLEEAVAALARRRAVPATIVWDSAVGASTRRRRSGLTVRYTTPEMTADDELVLEVQTLHGPDDPVVVVTDDSELRQRLSRLRVDLLDTRSLVWLLR